ncbi:ABC transporter permease [Microbacterium sp. LWH3-1.2]|uniref:ABC transporter permease n=1 Tax=Microbacterium sp. LWH3-1.2 TaxID=3135256 RepID=UPI00343BEF6A
MAPIRPTALPLHLAPVVVLAVALVVFALTTPAFVSFGNVIAIVNSATLTGIVAVGLTFVTISGNFLPLSVEQSAAMSAVTLAMMLAADIPAWVGVIAALAVGIAIGMLQGLIVSLGANPLVVTLAVGAALAGLVVTVTGGKTITFPAVEFFGDMIVFGIPVQTYVFVIVTVILTIYSARSRSGRAIRLLGENRLAARATGISVRATTMLAFGLAGVTVSLVSILSVVTFDRANATQFSGLTFDAIAAVLIGGTAIRGGHGSPLRSAIGAVFIALLMNVMLLREWSYGYRLLVEGIVVIAAVSIYRVLSARKEIRK